MSRRARKRNRARRRRLALVFALLFAPAARQVARAACVEFATPPEISILSDGATSAIAADIDRDGDLDVVSTSPYDSTVAWFENDGDGAGWTRHVVSTAFYGPGRVDAGDLDGDGDLDLVAMSQYVNIVAWYENDGTPLDDVAWALGTISTAAGAPVSVQAADLDGDGDLDVVSARISSDEITWYENDGGAGGWTLHLVSTAGDGAYTAFAADFDGDGDLDLLSGSIGDQTLAWYENDGTPLDDLIWALHEISTSVDFAFSVATADLDGDGDLDALAADLVQNQILWFENDGTPGTGTWAEHEISSSAPSARGVFAADFDADGDLDVLSSSDFDGKIAWHENDGTPAVGGWTVHTLSTAHPRRDSAVAADLDGDGDLDALSTSQVDDTVSWYRNDRLHNSALLAPAATISTAGDQTVAVIAADLDGDGDLDAVSASYNDSEIAWSENLGGSPLTWTRHAVSTAPAPLGAFAVVAGDVDRDGDLDLVTAAFGFSQIHWYENDGDGAVWARRTITNLLFNPIALDAADLDRDGDLDVAVAAFSGNAIAWGENDGTPLVGDWTVRTVSNTVPGASSVVVADLDRDGDPDLVAAASNSDAFLWFASDGTPADGGWTPRTIAAGTAIDSPQAVVAADLDGDGDLDVAGAATNVDTVVWYENDGTTTPTLWTPHTVSTAPDAPTALFAADLDGDGDVDLLATAQQGNAVVWFENDGSGTTWTEHTLSTTAIQARAVHAADLDGDGDLDALSGTVDTDELAWYENLGTGVFDDGFDSDGNKACWSNATP